MHRRLIALIFLVACTGTTATSQREQKICTPAPGQYTIHLFSPGLRYEELTSQPTTEGDCRNVPMTDGESLRIRSNATFAVDGWPNVEKIGLDEHETAYTVTQRVDAEYGQVIVRPTTPGQDFNLSVE